MAQPDRPPSQFRPGPEPAAAIVLVYGTRPEVVKLRPVADALRRLGVPYRCLATGQHTTLLDQTADTPWHQAFVQESATLGLPPDENPVLFAERVDRAVGDYLMVPGHQYQWVIVQGDTASAYGAALAASRLGIPLAHIEAGVRSGDPSNPWPEEQFRTHIDRIAQRHFAPTQAAATNLVAEGVLGTVSVPGNTGIDDLYSTMPRYTLPLDVSHPPRVLLTLHRRENWASLEQMVAPLNWLAKHRDNIVFRWPVHPNPRVQAVAATCGSIQTSPPTGVMAFRHLLAASVLVVTDSGGVQEEACHLGVPCLVARTVTDRPESVAAGLARVVGTDGVAIAEAVRQELDTPTMQRNPARVYGDGHAADRIVAGLFPTMGVP